MSEDIYKAARHRREISKLSDRGRETTGVVTGAGAGIVGGAAAMGADGLRNVGRAVGGKGPTKMARLLKTPNREALFWGGLAGVGGLSGLAAAKVANKRRREKTVEKAVSDSALRARMAFSGPRPGSTELRQQFGAPQSWAKQRRGPAPWRPTSRGRGKVLDIDQGNPALTTRGGPMPAARPGLDPKGTVASHRGTTTGGGRSASQRSQDWGDQLRRVRAGGGESGARAGEQLKRWTAGQDRRNAVVSAARERRVANPFGTPGRLDASPRVQAAARARSEAARAAQPAKKRSWFGR